MMEPNRTRLEVLQERNPDTKPVLGNKVAYS